MVPRAEILGSVAIIAGAVALYVLVLWLVTPWFAPGWRPFVPGLVFGAGSVTTIVLINLFLRTRRNRRT